MSRFGTLSAQAPSLRVRLRLVWYACRALGVLADADEAGVDALGLVLHGTLEQQVAVRLGRDVVLQRAEVVHLVAVGVVQRDLLGGGALAHHAGVGAHPGVVAAERHRGEQRGGVALAGGLLVTELPHGVGRAG